jgi:capsid portal protein
MTTEKDSSQNSPSSQDQPVIRVHFEKGIPSAVRQLINTDKDKKKPHGLEEHPLNLNVLPRLIERSGLLQPNVKVYTVNVHTTGHTFIPAIDLKAPDALDKIKEAIYDEKLIAASESGISIENVEKPSDDEITERFNQVKRQARLEYAIATNFFESCVPDGNFVSLRTRTGYDYENLGNAYWEVLRGDNGKPRTLEHVPGHTIRIAKEDPKVNNSMPIFIHQRVSALTYDKVKTRKTFRRFAQVDDSGVPFVWFKEFGDRRLMSQKTGSYYSSMDDLMKEEKHSNTATELLAFQQYFLNSPYGIPRWAGNLPAVLGSRELDETNYDYFVNSAIPALALLVSGGKFGSGAQEKLNEFFAEEARGDKSQHRLIVLEAESQRRGSTGQTVNPKIEFVPLRNAQLNDALFQVYDKNNKTKVDTSFRLPASLTGSEKVSLAELRFAEDQVFGPERDDFDASINNSIMPELGVTFWKFMSNTISPRDPEVLGKLTLSAADTGLIVPGEGRKLLEKSLGFDLPEIDAQWIEQPLPFTIAALGVKAGPAEAVREQGRQAGNPPPIDQLTEELGISTNSEVSRGEDSGALTVLSAIETLNKPRSRNKDDD